MKTFKIKSVLLFALVLLFANAQAKMTKGSVPFYSGRILAAEISLQEVPITNVSPYEKAFRATNKAFAQIVVSLDKGRRLSIYDYSLIPSGETKSFRCRGIRVGDKPYDAKNWKFDKTDPTKKYSLLFFIPAPSPEQKEVKLLLINQLLPKIKDEMNGFDVEFTNLVDKPFTPAASIGEQGMMLVEVKDDPAENKESTTEKEPELAAKATENKPNFWLKLDTAKEKTLLDSSGNNLQTKMIGKYGVGVPGKINKAVRLDKKGSFTTTGLKYGKEKDPNFTLTFWFRLDKKGILGRSDSLYLYSHGDNLTEKNNLHIFFSGDKSKNHPGVLRTCFNDSNDKYPIKSNSMDVPATKLSDAKWHFYALVVAKGVGAKVYIDGKMAKEDPARGGDAFIPKDPLTLGTRSFNNANQGFIGDLDELQVYNAALTPEEIGKLFQGEAKP